MTVHLLRMAVGINSIADLIDLQERRRQINSDSKLFNTTRNVPKRVDELLDGGSIYWVIKRLIRVRQRIISINQEINNEGKKYCLIEIDPKQIKVEPRTQKPFQGWRYLNIEDAPVDIELSSSPEAELPEEMLIELKELGLM